MLINLLFISCKYMICLKIKITWLTRKKNQLDYTTFTTVLKRNEIKLVKDKIKELYKYKYVYI